MDGKPPLTTLAVLGSVIVTFLRDGSNVDAGIAG
jgi:hypothetical protein